MANIDLQGIDTRARLTVGPAGLPITNNLAFRYDATTLALSDGAEVVSWLDSGPNSRNLVPISGGLGPVYRSTGLLGKPSVESNGGGANDRKLTCTEFSYLPPWTIFVVKKSIGIVLTELWHLGSSAGTEGIQLEFFHSLGLGNFAGVGIRDDVNGANDLYATDPDDTNAHLYTARSDSVNVTTGVTLRKDRTDLTTSRATVRTGGSGHIIFSSKGDGCRLSELIAYSVTLSDSDRDSVESYLRNKWGTP